MAHRRETRIEVSSDRGVFMISVAAQLADMHPQTLRTYEARGLIEPTRSPKGTRLYSQEDVERLRRIQEMTAELGLNLAGVERVLDLEAEIEQMHARIEELELQALRAQVELAERLEEVRRSYRAELVPYRGGSGELVRAADVRPAVRRREGWVSRVSRRGAGPSERARPARPYPTSSASALCTPSASIGKRPVHSTVSEPTLSDVPVVSALALLNVNVDVVFSNKPPAVPLISRNDPEIAHNSPANSSPI
jgi:MerR family transcriptional regulator, heat shock protein HspR